MPHASDIVIIARHASLSIVVLHKLGKMHCLDLLSVFYRDNYLPKQRRR